ncbi:glycerol-3-phosphate 1-O-acyltransferase PlsY [bacterium]|nr:glycerol-3-phosphate 1-O-acyltransferase PlsY [bacterium]
MIWTLILLVSCYLIGSFPTSLIVAKRHAHVDLRKVGSGNLGATNVYRVLGAKWALIVLAVDIFKGVLAVGLSYLTIMPLFMAPMVKIAFGLAAIVGHNWSIFAGFKGGKGVATSCGVLAAIAPVPTGMAFLLWAGVFAITRVSSIATLSAAFSLPILMGLYEEGLINIALSVALAVLVVYSHRDNIRRLMKGEEKPLDFSQWREHK